MTDIGNKCVECMRDTSFGTGLFVNRIPADREIYGDDGNFIEYRDGYLCPECNRIECDRCDELIACDEDIGNFDVYPNSENNEFEDGAWKVHYGCLTKEEKQYLAKTNGEN